jgi:hypothetical protein
MKNYPLTSRNEPNYTPSSGQDAPAAPVGIRRSTIGALRLKTGVKSGYLGNNPGGQGRNHVFNPLIVSTPPPSAPRP